MEKTIQAVTELEATVRDLKRSLTNAAFALEDNARLLQAMREARQNDPGLAICLDSIGQDMRTRSMTALKAAI